MECEVCGNESDDAFEVVRHVGRHRFDTFECAIYALAPVCAHCGVRVIGHPVSEDDHAFCCSHCAEAGPRQGQESEASESSSDEPDDEDEDEEDEGGEDQEEEDEEGEEEDDDEGDDEGGDEPSDEQLEKLDQRIGQARQDSEDLITSPEDEVDQDEADVEPEAEVGEEETDEEGREDTGGGPGDKSDDGGDEEQG